MFKYIILLVVFSTTSAVLRTIVFSNYKYYGHFLTGATGVASTPLTITNPPVNTNHKWIVDWDTIFDATKDSVIKWGADSTKVIQFTSAGTRPSLIVSPPVVAAQYWILSYKQNGTTYLYQIKNKADGFCVYDMFGPTGTPNEFGPVMSAVANPAICNDDSAWWNIYSA